MPLGTENWLHFAPAILMLVIFCINLTLTHRSVRVRSSTEAARFQVAMLAELEGLAELYRKNLELLRKDAHYLLSTRSAVAVYRGNIGRLTLLDEAQIRGLVSVHSANEHIEILLSAHAKSVKSGAALIYRFEPGQRDIGNFRRMYLKALENVSHARELLGSGDIPDATSQPAAPQPTQSAEGEPAPSRAKGSSGPKIPLPSTAEA